MMRWSAHVLHRKERSMFNIHMKTVARVVPFPTDAVRSQANRRRSAVLAALASMSLSMSLMPVAAQQLNEGTFFKTRDLQQKKQFRVDYKWLDGSARTLTQPATYPVPGAPGYFGSFSKRSRHSVAALMRFLNKCSHSTSNVARQSHNDALWNRARRGS